MSRQLKIILIILLIAGGLCSVYSALRDRFTFFGMWSLLNYPIGLFIVVIASLAILHKAFKVLIVSILSLVLVFLSGTIAEPICNWQLEQAETQGASIVNEIESHYQKEGNYPKNLSELGELDTVFFLGVWRTSYYYKSEDSTFTLGFRSHGGGWEEWRRDYQGFSWHD